MMTAGMAGGALTDRCAPEIAGRKRRKKRNFRSENSRVIIGYGNAPIILPKGIDLCPYIRTSFGRRLSEGEVKLSWSFHCCFRRKKAGVFSFSLPHTDDKKVG